MTIKQPGNYRRKNKYPTNRINILLALHNCCLLCEYYHNVLEGVSLCRLLNWRWCICVRCTLMRECVTLCNCCLHYEYHHSVFLVIALSYVVHQIGDDAFAYDVHLCAREHLCTCARVSTCRPKHCLFIFNCSNDWLLGCVSVSVWSSLT